MKNFINSIELFLKSLLSDDKSLIKAIKSLGISKPITLIDVGSAKGIQPRWEPIQSLVYVYGFEPDDGARKKLSNTAGFEAGGNMNYPYALSDTNDSLSLNILKKPSHSSVFKPNYDAISLFTGRVTSGFDFDYEATVPARSLDSLELEAADFIKIDVQGYELKVLEGSKNTLKNCIGVETEVEFIELYKDQPKFGEISSFMEEQDLAFIDFTTLTRWERDSMTSLLGSCFGGDALFMRLPEYMLENFVNDQRMIDVYLSLCLLYRRFDFINVIIEKLDLTNDARYKDFIDCAKNSRGKLHSANRLSRISERLIALLLGHKAGVNTIYY
ncbi:FkbM family methyltransferase [Gammaproteobacteria bacterium]|nr:FkbM family methyltransferase [Gammaproteobacteria bacterium]